jgi:uncharacterized repeat protein (TIGR01451 family)
MIQLSAEKSVAHPSNGPVQSRRAMTLRIHRWFGVVGVWLLLTATAHGQTSGGTITAGFSGPASVDAGREATYITTVTNLTFGPVADVFITNSFPTNLPFRGVFVDAPIHGSTVSPGRVVVTIPSMAANEVVQARMTFLFSLAGTYTLTSTVSGTIPGSPFFTPIDLSLGVEAVDRAADLALSAGAPSRDAVLIGDQITGSVTVRNLGPDTATAIVITNTPGRGVRVESGAVLQTNGTFTISISQLGPNQTVSRQFVIVPTNSGALTIRSSVGSAVPDRNATNNTAEQSVNVLELETAVLTVTNLGGIRFDPQTGLLLQGVRLVNVGTNTIRAARVVVTNLSAAARLVNRSGTGDSGPFVELIGQSVSNMISPREAVDFTLEYSSTNRADIGAPAYVAGATLPPSRAGTVSAADVAVSRVVLTNRVDGGVLVEFPAQAGGTYRIQYATNADFTAPWVVVPDPVAPGNRIQWLDLGQPNTSSHPTNAATRFYRVRQLVAP